jgi:hypothetical protein
MELVSKSDLFRSLRKQKYDPSDDQLDRLRRAGLIPPFVSVEGKGNERFVSAEGATRIEFYYKVRRRYMLKKPRTHEVAFWFAACGFSVPPHLVAAHLEKSVEVLRSRLYRLIDRRASNTIPLDEFEVPDALYLGDLFAKSILEMFKLPANGIARAAAGALSGLILRVLLRCESYSQVSGAILRVLEFLGFKEPSRWAKPAWEGAQEFLSFFRVGDENRLHIAIRKALRENPGQVIRSAQDGLIFAATGSRAFPWFTDARTLVGRVPGFREGDARFTDRYMIPVFGAMLVFARNNCKTTEQFIVDLRAGNADIVEEFMQIRDALPELRRRLGGAA